MCIKHMHTHRYERERKREIKRVCVFVCMCVYVGVYYVLHVCMYYRLASAYPALPSIVSVQVKSAYPKGCFRADFLKEFVKCQ